VIAVAERFTEEQWTAIERRDGHLLLDASAGSGKTSVLVERFVRAVQEDGVAVRTILAITFTEKAAAELRERIRRRLRELGDLEAARATESAFISTIHGFCARVLRTVALSAGIDPQFKVLDGPQSERLADHAFDGALEELARDAPGGIELIASYGPGALRGAIIGVYGELRSRGQLEPSIPPLGRAPDLDQARLDLERAADALAAELEEIESPPARVQQALERLARCGEVSAAAEPWPGELERLKLPGGNGSALCTPACVAYGEALANLRRACEHVRAMRAHVLLDQLLRSFGRRYAAHKRAASGVDFADLELLVRRLFAQDGELRERYSQRFAHVMVDELQDTNTVQLELIDLVASNNLFMVGDAQQSIYGFRHAAVELFEQRSEELERGGRRVTLRQNFRSRAEILDVLNAAFGQAMGERFRPLVAGRADAVAGEPRVELLVSDKGADWAGDGLASPWRLAEARALAARIAALLERGTEPQEIVVLTRATTDLRAYERALEELGVPTYVIGGRGYWEHPQVHDVVAYLRALANPRDEAALYTVLASPFVGITPDALVVLAGAAHATERDPWWLLREPEGRLDELTGDERDALSSFARWFAQEREIAAYAGVEELIERALERSGYDLTMLALPGGQRRLANVRKLMRLAREHEAIAGRGLSGFLELVAGRERGSGGSASRESEAPVEGEALNAVRLMTIHRAKGLEFNTVCVADLGRGPVHRAELLRLGADGRFGMRLAQPGTAKRQPALDYVELGDERQRFEREEQGRLFYVAMTRACERLVVSGAAPQDDLGDGATPMSWVGPALVEAGVQPKWISPEDLGPTSEVDVGPGAVAAELGRFADADAVDEQAGAARPSALSYSALEQYQRCGYRFYVERVLGVPGVEAAGTGGERAELSAADRGILVHALLERLDFRRPLVPSSESIKASARGRVREREAAELAGLVERFAASELCGRLGGYRQVNREQRFAFKLSDELLITGVFDVLAREGDAVLVVDYKSDRLGVADPVEVAERSYAVQRLVYALAALRAGAGEVEVVHVFLDAPERPVVVNFSAAAADRLEAELWQLVSGVCERRFEVTGTPHRGVCTGCPAEGGLCSWPLEMTRRDAPDRLF
jgi:ATP-dependent helicase/nuclease subunit A